MQLLHPLYDLGSIMLERNIAEMQGMLVQLDGRQDLPESSRERLGRFNRLVNRFQEVKFCMPAFCSLSETIDVKADKLNGVIQKIKSILCPDESDDAGTAALLAELASAIKELEAKPNSNSRSAGLAIMCSAYQCFYHIFTYFGNERATI